MTIAVVTSLSPQSKGLRRNYDVKIIIFFVLLLHQQPPRTVATSLLVDWQLRLLFATPAKADMPMVTADEFNTLCAIRPKVRVEFFRPQE
jgi:hypothetical protein